MQNLLNDLTHLLSQKEKYVSNGKLLKNIVVEDALRLEPSLLKLLITDAGIKKHFFQDVDSILVFDKIKFQKFISNKQFLPDSYTAFKNKIGLTINDEYLSENKEVVLSWPYKDCLLEGGQDKEDAKRNEIFWNETLAPNEIDRLLSPKVLRNWKKYDKDGEHNVDAFSDNDNLIIKGNNLLGLTSLLKRYRGKIKLIYIDPPYNTGNDGFNYNDSFNHSTWLTFMKNRLLLAKELLSNDGSIWISLDDNELHYCKVNCDEIFGRDNFISTIIWNSKYTVSNDAKYISYQHENILFYAKNKSSFNIGLLERTEEQNNSYRNPDNDVKGVWKATPLHAKSGKEENNYTITFPNGYIWTPPKGRYPRYSQKRLLEIYEEGGLYFNKNGGVDKKTYLSEVKQGVTSGSVWSYEEVGHTHANNEEMASILGKGVFNNPKGTSLLKKIIKVANANEEDTILDYHAGSGTTAHAVLELNKEDGGNRKFILLEQMDYIHTVTCPRVQKVLEKEDIDASFVYCELAKANQQFIDTITVAKDTQTLLSIWKSMLDKAFISYKVDIQSIQENISGFEKLSFDDQKRFLIEVLDKNMLYVPHSEIDDEDYQISEADKKLNRIFYDKH